MTIANLIQEYPQFVANQVLTQDQLNNMRIFLDSQNRATRVRMIGIGIICGLHTRIENTGGLGRRLIITEGYGVTSEGWLIQIPETTYTHLQDYTDPYTAETETAGTPDPAYLPWQTAYNKTTNPIPGAGSDLTQITLKNLLTEEDPVNTSVPITRDRLKGKVLVLYLELNETELKSCFTTDCNNKGQSVELKVQALLANKDDRFLPVENCKTMGALQPVPRFNTGLKKTAGIEMPDISNRVQINNAYRDICDYLNNELGTKAPALFNTNKAFFDLYDVEARIASLSADLTSLLNLPNFDQYRYDLFKDITQAYNELVQHLCHIVEPCCNPESFDRHLVVRSFEGNSLTKDLAYRHPFYASPVRNVMHHDYEKARRMFKRVLNLVANVSFITSADIDNIKITPGQTDAYPLAEQTIPHYYNKSNVEESWRLGDCCTLPALSYQDNQNELVSGTPYLGAFQNPLHYNINACSLLRIENELRIDYSTAQDRIIELRRLFNLDFQVLALPLDVPAFDYNPPGDITDKYLTYRKLWMKLYERIDAGDMKKEEFEARILELQELEEIIIGMHQDWCAGQDYELRCDYMALQADYSILRAELLCFLHKCKPMFNNIPEIDFGRNDGVKVGETCVIFPQELDGRDITAPGEELVNFDDIIVTTEVYKFEEIGQGTYNNVDFFNFNTKLIPSLTLASLKFDLNPKRLGFATKEVRFKFTNYENPDDPNTIYNNNINVNNNSETRVVLMVNRAGKPPLEIYPGIFFEAVEVIPNQIYEGIITGEEITEVVIGGIVLAISDFCVVGEKEVSEKDDDNLDLAFEARFFRLKRTCAMLEATTALDIRCFDFNLFKNLIKDLSCAAMEIKLLLAYKFDQSGGVFYPYRYYPVWNDLEDCFDHLHGTCFHPRFAAAYFAFVEVAKKGGPLTFGEFVAKYPGVEHRAGVAKGGAFLMVYENEATPEVLADFSLEHYVEDCCPCDIDFRNIELPPIALPDYRIFRISEPGEFIEEQIAVLENDFNLNNNTSISELFLENNQSDRGANLEVVAIELDNGVKTFVINYKREESKIGLDHFTYQIVNAKGETDTGHVHIGVFPPKANIKTEVTGGGTTPSKTGTVRGFVAGDITTAIIPLVGARVRLERLSGALVDEMTITEKTGAFALSAGGGTYKLIASRAGFFSKDIQQAIVAGEDKNLGTVTLRRNPNTGGGGTIGTNVGNLNVATTRFATNTELLKKAGLAIKEDPSYPLAEAFIEKTVTDSTIPEKDVSKSYKAAVAALIKTTKDPDLKKRRAAANALMAITHSYMDRVVINNPEKASAATLKDIKQTTDKIAKAGVSTQSLLNKWKSNSLRTDIGGGTKAIAEIRKTLSST